MKTSLKIFVIINFLTLTIGGFFAGYLLGIKNDNNITISMMIIAIGISMIFSYYYNGKALFYYNQNEKLIDEIKNNTTKFDETNTILKNQYVILNPSSVNDIKNQLQLFNLYKELFECMNININHVSIGISGGYDINKAIEILNKIDALENE